MPATGQATVTDAGTNADVKSAWLQPDTDISGTLGAMVDRFFTGYGDPAAAVVDFVNRTVRLAPRDGLDFGDLGDMWDGEASGLAAANVLMFVPETLKKVQQYKVYYPTTTTFVPAEITFATAPTPGTAGDALDAAVSVLAPRQVNLSPSGLLNRMEDAGFEKAIVVQFATDEVWNFHGIEFPYGVILGILDSPTTEVIFEGAIISDARGMTVAVSGSLAVSRDLGLE